MKKDQKFSFKETCVTFQRKKIQAENTNYSWNLDGSFQQPFEGFPVSYFVPPWLCEDTINKTLSSGASY